MTDWSLTQFARNRSVAPNYKAFVQDGIDAPNVRDDPKRQVYLGDNQFVEGLQRYLGTRRSISIFQDYKEARVCYRCKRLMK